MDRDPIHIQVLQSYQPVVTSEANRTITHNEVLRGATSVGYVDELSRGFHYRSDDFKVSSATSSHSSVNLIRGIESANLADGGENAESSSPKNEPAAQPRRIARHGSRGNLSKFFGSKADSRRTKRTKSFGESFTTLPYVHVRKNDERDPTLRVMHEGLTRELLLSMHESPPALTTSLTIESQPQPVTSAFLPAKDTPPGANAPNGMTKSNARRTL
ncbi:unnamed protein product [Aphanomyces euteiches]